MTTRYAVIVIDGQGFEASDEHAARLTCAIKNHCEKEHIKAFKNGETIYFVPMSERDRFQMTIERETGVKSQVCTFQKNGDVRVW